MTEKNSVGSCLCGSIKFNFYGNPKSFSLCHCKMCRKFSGSAFGAFIGVPKKHFSFNEGKDLEKIIKSSDWASRTFCPQCGSSLRYIYDQDPETIYISAGTLDTEIEFEPQRHIFVKDKCSWFDSIEHIPQVEKY